MSPVIVRNESDGELVEVPTTADVTSERRYWIGLLLIPLVTLGGGGGAWANAKAGKLDRVETLAIVDSVKIARLEAALTDFADAEKILKGICTSLHCVRAP